jgi:hypothetical protein
LGLLDQVEVLFWTQTHIRQDSMESSADTLMDLIDTRIPSIGYLNLDGVVPLVASLHNVWAKMVVSVTGPGNCMTALLTDNEVPHLGILDIVSNDGNAGPTVNGLTVFFGHLKTEQIPLLFNKQQCK